MGSQAVKHLVALPELLQAPENLLEARIDAAEMLLSEHGKFPWDGSEKNCGLELLMGNGSPRSVWS